MSGGHGMSSFKRVQQWLTFARQWHIINAAWQDPDKLAAKIIVYLRGMNKPIFHVPPTEQLSDLVFGTIHKADPCRIMFMAVSYALRGPHSFGMRRLFLERLHVFPDKEIPKKLLMNVSSQLRQVMPIPKTYDDYTEEEKAKFPIIYSGYTYAQAMSALDDEKIVPG
ncbi:unnamed protein product [Soboliphyme baturini]|uniref:39S ribosomal protein L22, mitochondrial n=1 Tax=Soboliphyme baturini TaxID=241478 RepID=A0A183IGK4_9BILA|nr:unnamed protein product [Soboliphyme baturini]